MYTGRHCTKLSVPGNVGNKQLTDFLAWNSSLRGRFWGCSRSWTCKIWLPSYNGTYRNTFLGSTGHIQGRLIDPEWKKDRMLEEKTESLCALSSQCLWSWMKMCRGRGLTSVCVYLRATPKSSRCPPFPIRVLFSLLNLMLIVSLCIYIYSQRRVVRRTEAYVTVCGQPIE